MSRRIAAVALVVVLIASALVGYGAVSDARAAPTPPAAPTSSPSSAGVHPAATDITIETFNGQGVGTTYFCTGSCTSFTGEGSPGASTLYFSILDTAADLTVNVTINDPNATRDALVNPVFSATVGINQVTHENLTPTDNHFAYTFPASLAIGGGWNITASAPLGGFANLNLTVQTYSLALESTPDSGSITVPGESVSVSWVVSASSNGALYTQFTSLIATGTFVNATPMNLFSPGLYPLPHAGAGTWTVKVPDNATPDTEITLEVWAVTNVSGEIAENESGFLTFWVGIPDIFETTAQSYSSCSDVGEGTDTFSSGAPVFVCTWIGARAAGHGATDYVPGLSVEITFWDGLQNVTPGGDPPTMLVTTANGPSAFSFIPTAPPFSSYYAYPFGNSFNLTVTDPAATTLGYPGAYWNYSFQVVPNAASGAVQVTLNAIDYAVGQTVFANWTLGSSNASAVGGLVATQWVLVTTGGFASTGPISSTASTGMIEVPLPAGYVGEFVVVVVAANVSGDYLGAGIGYAEQPTLLLSVPGDSWYVPGQTLSFPVQLTPGPLAGTTIYYNITGEWWSYAVDQELSEGIVAVGTVSSSGMVSFTVPVSNPATQYSIEVWAQSPTAGFYASAGAEVFLATGYQVLLGVTTASSYSDGSYQPGQTIQVSWSLSPLGTAPLPGYYAIYLDLGDTPVTPYWETTSSSGTVSVTIPSNTPSGTVDLYMYVYANGVYGPDCSNGYECYGDSGIVVNDHPSVLSEELGAGSGITVGWLILLIVILVVAVILVLLIRRGRAPKGPKPAYATPAGSIGPPAPAPSTPPAAQWNEPTPTPPSAPATDAPPPLPTPPEGAQ
jgi:hypothetical protein